MNLDSLLAPFRPSPADRVPWWIDPGRWHVPSPLAIGAVALLTVAAAATWWCMRQPLQVGVPALIFVLFAELVVVLGLGAARARAVVWESLARISKLESVLEELRRIAPPRPELHGGHTAAAGDLARRPISEPTMQVRLSLMPASSVSRGGLGGGGGGGGGAGAGRTRC